MPQYETRTITTFLTFPGTAADAIDFYTAVFPGSRIIEIELHDENGPGEPGKVLTAVVKLLDTEMMFMDMRPSEVPAFTWATSLLVSCENQAEFDLRFAKLSEGGTVMMGPEPWEDLRMAAWVTDKFGVTWQILFQ